MSSEVINYYKKMPKKRVHNPGFNQHHIDLPFRGILVGPSGSGKTNLLLNLIHLMKNTFEFIQICTMDASEPLYQYLKEAIPPEQLQISEGFEAIPPLDHFRQFNQSLICFDDLCSTSSGKDKRQEIISEYYKRGRKIGATEPNTRGGLSMIYLSQSYFGIPKFIRIQGNYIFLKRTNDQRDLGAILKDCSIGIRKFELEQMYNFACCKNQGIEGFLFFLKDAGEIRAGWDTLLHSSN